MTMINGLGYWLNVVNEIETDAATVSLVAQGLGGTILPRLAAEPIPEGVGVYSLPIVFGAADWGGGFE